MEEIKADTQRILRGEEVSSESHNTVKDLPNNFKDWIRDNAERTARAKSLPYFIRDNQEVIDNMQKATTSIAKDDRSARTALQINEIQRRWDERRENMSPLNDICKELEQRGIARNDVSALSSTLSEKEIIDRVGGGDRTSGSCSSLALTYAANKCGYDVLDFRDGESRKYFASALNIIQLSEKVGGIIEYSVTGSQMLKNVDMGKEYYFASGRHAAIVRKSAARLYEYLELQPAFDNGWKPLNARAFSSRFGAAGRGFGILIPVENFNIPGFRKMMGYINTETSQQNKGYSGTIR